MTNDQQGHPSSKANNHFTCGACSSGCGWDCAAAPEGRRNFLVSRACCTVYCNLPGCCFQLRTGAKKTHPGSMGGDEMPLRKIAASLAENSGFSCDCALAVNKCPSLRPSGTDRLALCTIMNRVRCAYQRSRLCLRAGAYCASIADLG